jgi:hypothetical protein
VTVGPPARNEFDEVAMPIIRQAFKKPLVYKKISLLYSHYEDIGRKQN